MRFLRDCTILCAYDRIRFVVSRIEITVSDNERRMRLEDLLCARFPALSKMYLRDVIKTGGCEVNGRHENRGKHLRPGDFIELSVDLTREHSMLAQDIPLDIAYEDADLIVVNKPAGMLVHPSHCEKNGTLLNAVVHHINRSNGGHHRRPGLIHRLDKDTSGLLVVAKHDKAHEGLARQFADHSIDRRYMAIVTGIPRQSEGRVDAPLARSPQNRKKIAIVAAGKGKRA